jgi:hypothetical protein
MEKRLGADLSSVRMHSDRSAADAARGLKARAFTLGSDVYFNSTSYQPQSPQGRFVLAHELVHVLQQRMGARTNVSATAGGQHEREANQFASDVQVQGSSGSTPVGSTISPVSPGTAQCIGMDDPYYGLPREAREEQRSEVPSVEEVGADPNKMWSYLARKSHELAVSRKTIASASSASEYEISNLVRLTALGLMASHRARIVEVRDMTLSELAGGAGKSPSVCAAALGALRSAGLAVHELNKEKARLKEKRRELERLRSDIIRNGPANEIAVEMYKVSADDMTEPQADEFRRQYEATDNVLSFDWRQCNHLVQWRTDQIAAIDRSIYIFYEAFPVLSRLEPEKIAEGQYSEDQKLIQAVRDGFEDILHDVDRAIRMIADGDVHPFDLPEAVRATHEMLPADSRESLDRAIKDRKTRQFWIERGIDLLTAAVMFVPVVGPVVLAGVALASTGSHVSDMIRRSLLADASTNPYASPIGVDQPSKLEMVLAGVEIILTGVALKAAASELRGLRVAPEPRPPSLQGEVLPPEVVPAEKGLPSGKVRPSQGMADVELNPKTGVYEPVETAQAGESRPQGKIRPSEEIIDVEFQRAEPSSREPAQAMSPSTPTKLAAPAGTAKPSALPAAQAPRALPAGAAPELSAPSRVKVGPGEPSVATTPTKPGEVTEFLRAAGLEESEIISFGGADAKRLGSRSAARVARLAEHFTPEDLKALGRYLWTHDMVLNDAMVEGLIDRVRPGGMAEAMRNLDIAAVRTGQVGVGIDFEAQGTTVTEPAPPRLRGAQEPRIDPAWRIAELQLEPALEKKFGKGWQAARRMPAPGAAPGETLGSTVPEYYHPILKKAFEVKRLNLGELGIGPGGQVSATPSESSVQALDRARRQLAGRRWALPEGTEQSIVFNITGQATDAAAVGKQLKKMIGARFITYDKVFVQVGDELIEIE